MTRDQIKEVFLRHGFKIHEGFADLKPYVYEAAEALLAAERERIAAEFDRRAVYRDGTPSTGWYEPHEPAEIIRSMK